jgi:N-acetylglucosamine kinase-like BadF-type ATPase
MILIADSGSTKTSWLLVNNNQVIEEITTSGYNPYYYKGNGLVELIKKELEPELSTTNITKIFFYGSGCSSDFNCTMVKSALWEIFPNAAIEINHDLKGAAVALLKNEPGIACILGTGSNSCLWNGQKILENVPSVGYLLGDEGSGTYIGMKILKGVLENTAPESIINEFYTHYKLNFENTLYKIYNEPEPNRFFSSICLFASEHLGEKWIYNAVKQSFIEFINNQIKNYSNYKESEVCFTGSVAYSFKNILVEACAENDIKTGIFLKNPIEGLFDYHTL